MAAQLLKKAVLPLAKILTTHNKDLKEKTEQQALRIQDLENQLQYQSTTQQERPHVTLLGNSNCRDIHPHLMRWLSQDVKNGRIRLSVSTASRTYELSEETHVTWRTDFIRLGSVATNRKNGLTGEQLAVGTDSWSVITGPSRMFSLLWRSRPGVPLAVPANRASRRAEVTCLGRLPTRNDISHLWTTCCICRWV